MAAYLRLRQVCLVTSNLARETEAIKAVFGLDECYRDPNVTRYGLENVLFPIGGDFLEIVAPTQPGTAAGRFLERHNGRDGYMVILDCDDPESRQRHCAAIGVRTANLIRHEHYLGVQLHPKDTGGAMIEFNRTDDGEDPMGAYAPAGPAWQKEMRQDVTRHMVAAEIECPHPAAFAERWSTIVQRPARSLGNGGFQISLDTGAINVLPGDYPEPVLTGIELHVVDKQRVMDAARVRHCLAADGRIDICGIHFRLTMAG